ncbi:MAG: SprT-like domain-containing protein, partial [Bacteroidota bacterium]
MDLQHKEILHRYFPEETVDQVSSILLRHAIQLKLTRTRITKLGDYRPPLRGKGHRITINGSLGRHMIYLVFLHELAHLLVWNKYGNKARPHGRQWKEEFASLLQNAIYHALIPGHLKEQVLDFSKNIKATFAAHPALWKALRVIDSGSLQQVMVEDIPLDGLFVAANGRLFKREDKIRTRYRCYCLSNHRRYLFHAMAVVQPVEEEKIMQ